MGNAHNLQVLQALRLEVAYKAGVDPFDVSIGLLVQYAPQYGYEGRDPVKIFVERGRTCGLHSTIAQNAHPRPNHT